MSDNSEKESSEEYESEEDDDDYVPEGSASEEETKVEINRKRKNSKSKPKKTTKRKRRGGIQLDDEDSTDDESEDEIVLDDEEEDDDEEEEVEDEEEEEKGESEEPSKSRVDDLWKEFKKDTASSNKKENDEDLKNKPSSTISEEEPKQIEITEIFDFAGEEVKVVKTVSSLEATSKTESKKDTDKIQPNPEVIMKKKPLGLGSVLGKLGKKTKLSTLEKSKLDWNQFKQEEGIEDDLKTSNKDGYLEKTAFLNRVDQKQFEIERDVRQKARKK